MKIVIAGGSGFIGRKLSEHLVQEGHEVMILSRHPKQDPHVRYIQWLAENCFPEKEIESADVFINLAGVSVNGGRWNEAHQQQIYDSRVVATKELLRIMKQLESKPLSLINASAIGIYPTSGTEIYTEESTAAPNDFLGKTVHEWEQLALEAEKESIRVACMRFGIVLGTESGALPPMVMPYKLFVGGTVGSGEQWLSWVHIDDVIRAITFVMENSTVHGLVNVTAPFPKRMKYFGQTVANILKRPHWMPVPAFVICILLGKKSKLVLEGQYVTSEKLQKNGFHFKFPTLEEALND